MELNRLIKSFLIIILIINFQGNAQLIDPFGKVITHEIKLNKLKDGTYVGAMEWTTGGIDSIQRYIVSGLDVKAPVMVRIISKAPDHNIDLSFHKKNWDKIESKISTDGNKFVDKVFRTMNIAGLGVRSKVAGIPYLITVKVGLQFPSTKSLIRLTDDKEEYSRHLRKMGYNGALFAENNISNSNVASATNTIDSSKDNNNLMYVVIGLLAVIALVLIVFLMKRKTSKTMTLLLVTICFYSYTLAQKKAPTMVPVPGQGESPVFYEYRTQNVANQTPVNNNRPGKDGRIYGPTGIELGSGVKELTSEEAEAINKRMQEANREFDRNYKDDMPGQKTEGDQRIIPADQNAQEMTRLRTQVQQLQRQVDLLSQEDEAYDRDESENDEGEILIYCEQIEACHNCIRQGFNQFTTRSAYFDFLQKFYLKKSSDLNDWIEWGNAVSSLPNGGGAAWGPIYMYKVKPAMENLKKAYNDKFDEYIELMESDLEAVRGCYTGINDDFPSVGGYEIQMFAVINALKASRINK